MKLEPHEEAIGSPNGIRTRAATLRVLLGDRPGTYQREVLSRRRG